MTDDLSTRLLEAIGQREAAAREASTFAAATWSNPSTGVVDIGVEGLEGLLPTGDRGVAVHVALNDPESVLRLCQAHREIVDMYRRDEANASPDRWTLLEVIELLAEAYGIKERRSIGMNVTHTRTHVCVEFANPYLTCDNCDQWVTGWHDSSRCGCEAPSWNAPCGCTPGATSVCPSWGPVDGCQCQEHLGDVPHGQPAWMET